MADEQVSEQEVKEEPVASGTDKGDLFDQWLDSFSEEEPKESSDDAPKEEAPKEEVKAESEEPKSEAEPKKEETPKEEPKKVEVSAKEEKPKEEPKAEPAKETQPGTRPQPKRQDLKAAREELVKTIEASYKNLLTEEDAEKLLQDPREVLPRLIAHLYADLYEVQNQVMWSQMPQFVGQTIDARSTAKEREDAFFTRWPKLKEHVGNDLEKNRKLIQIGRAYQQIVPNASVEEAIEAVGAQAMSIFKIPFEAAPAQQQAPEPARETQPKPSGFKPASPGGASSSSSTPAKNDWVTTFG